MFQGWRIAIEQEIHIEGLLILNAAVWCWTLAYQIC